MHVLGQFLLLLNQKMHRKVMHSLVEELLGAALPAAHKMSYLSALLPGEVFEARTKNSKLSDGYLEHTFRKLQFVVEQEAQDKKEADDLAGEQEWEDKVAVDRAGEQDGECKKVADVQEGADLGADEQGSDAAASDANRFCRKKGRGWIDYNSGWIYFANSKTGWVDCLDSTTASEGRGEELETLTGGQIEAGGGGLVVELGEHGAESVVELERGVWAHGKEVWKVHASKILAQRTSGITEDMVVHPSLRRHTRSCSQYTAKFRHGHS